jgi:hypothetical protein
MFCFWCREVKLKSQESTPLECGCSRFHDECYREHLLLSPRDNKCPICDKVFEITNDAKESMLLWCRRNVWDNKGPQKTSDLEFLRTLADICPRSAFNAAAPAALQDPVLGRKIAEALPALIPAYLPPFRVALDLNLLSTKLAKKYVAKDPSLFLSIPVLLQQPDLAIDALRLDPKLFSEMPLRIRQNTLVADVAVRLDGLNYEHVDEGQKTMALATAAVRQNGSSFVLLDRKFKKKRQIMKFAVQGEPAVVDLIPKPRRRAVAETVLGVDGMYIDRFDGSNALAMLAVRTTPEAAFKLDPSLYKSAWAKAIAAKPLMLLQYPHNICKELWAYGVSKEPDALFKKNKELVRLSVVCGCSFDKVEALKDLEATKFYLKYSPHRVCLNRKFKNRECARTAVFEHSVYNVLGNEQHFTRFDMARLVFRAGTKLPVLSGAFSDDKLYATDVLTLKLFGHEYVACDRELVDCVLETERCDFCKDALFAWAEAGHLSTTETHAAVRRYPQILALLEDTERDEFMLTALTSPVKCSHLKFLTKSLRKYLRSRGKSTIATVLDAHPEYIEYMPWQVRSDVDIVVRCLLKKNVDAKKVLLAVSPEVLRSEAVAKCVSPFFRQLFMHSRFEPKAEAKTKTEAKAKAKAKAPNSFSFFSGASSVGPADGDGDDRLIRLLRTDLQTALVLHDFPPRLKSLAYGLVEADTSRRVLDLLNLKFPGILPRRIQDRLLKKGRIPSGCRTLKIPMATLVNVVDDDIQLAAEYCVLNAKNIAFFVRRLQFGTLRRASPQLFPRILRALSALPTELQECRRNPKATCLNFSSTK